MNQLSSIWAVCNRCGGIDFRDEMILKSNEYYDDECILEAGNE